ncbi:hypothetical protein [Pantoea sp. B65]|uniref:hypothetical protein n=1 Tax=Pantoea sp. B65 TaxID=2813359 RepID=UPI0039B66993
MNITNVLSGASTTQTQPSDSTSPLFNLLRAIINTRFGLSAAASTIDYCRAFAQAKRLLAVPQTDSGRFVATVRQRLAQPMAQALMRPAADTESFHSLKRWLPAIPEPLLSNTQLHQLICLALDIDTEKFVRLNIATRLQCHFPELNQLLVAEINLAAARYERGMAQTALPQLMRMKVVSENLALLHPLLPVALWSVQILWQLSQQGMIRTLDNELKIQLQQWLSALDIAAPLAGHQPRALADSQLFSALNNWTEQRLRDLRGSDGNRPLQERAYHITAIAGDYQQQIVTKPPVAPAMVRLAAPGWQVNSALNMAESMQGELLVNTLTCYELLKRESRPYNIAVACAVHAGNRTSSVQEKSSGALFSHMLVTDTDNQLWRRWQIEGGDNAFYLSGVQIPAARLRPLLLKPLAGAQDQLTDLPVAGDMPAAESIAPLLSTMMAWTQQQLSAIDGIPLRLQAVTNVPAQQKLAASGSWLFTGAAAQSVGLSAAAPPSAGAPPAGVTADDFWQSLLFKYRETLTQTPQVTLRQYHRGTIRDKVLPLKTALQMLELQPPETGPVVLNYPAGWSNALRTEVDDFVLKKEIPALDDTQPMDWESADNQYASWLTAVGLANQSLERMSAIIHQLQSPVWDIRRWIEDQIHAMVKQTGGDSNKVNASTPIGVGVRMPAAAGRQHIPTPLVAGEWYPVDPTRKYTLQDILLREHYRGYYRPEALELQFPPEINQQLKESIRQTDLQAIYMNQLTATLAAGEVKQGMLALFNVMFDRVFDAWYQQNKAGKGAIDAHKIRAALEQKRYFRLQWQGYQLNNLVFIAQEAGNDQQGVIFSLWDEKYWAVNIDPLRHLSCLDNSDASELLERIYSSLSIQGRVACKPATLEENKIVINTSGHYIIEFIGKTWTRKNWIEPTADKSHLSLLPTAHLADDLFATFVATLRADMDYLAKSDREHLLDSAIEVLNTIAMIMGIYVVPLFSLPAGPLSIAAGRMSATLASWRTSLMISCGLSIFPNLVRAATTDRREQALRSYLDALMGLLGEGSGYLAAKYFPRVIACLFKQAGKVVKVSIDQIPDPVMQRIIRHAKQVFSGWQAEICQIAGIPAAGSVVNQSYSLPFYPGRAPAPASDIWQELTDLPPFIDHHYGALLQADDLYRDPGKMPAVVQDYLRSKEHQVQIGVLLRWNNPQDSQPERSYLLRVNSPQPQTGSPYSEFDDVIVEFVGSDDNKAQKIRGLAVNAKNDWLQMLPDQPENQNKTVSVEWFATPQGVLAREQVLQSAPAPIFSFAETMVVRAGWYHQLAIPRALQQISQLQQSARQEIFLTENQINVRDNRADPQRLSLTLGELFASGRLRAFDALAEKIRVLAEHPINKQPVALPGGSYLLIGTDLRGISRHEHNDTVVITDFGATVSRLRQHQLQGYRPQQVADAGMAAVISSLYCARVDDFLLHRQHLPEQLTGPALRISRLAQSAGLFGRQIHYLRVPLIVAIKNPQKGSQLVNDYLPASEILFVLAPDDLIGPVGDILSSLREQPIPVRPLLIENVPALVRAMVLAESYALLPSFDDAQQALGDNQYRPWITIINLQAASGFISNLAAQRLRQQTDADSWHDFLGERPLSVTSLGDISNAQPGARLAFFAVTAGPGKPPLSHAMMMLDDGSAVGTHNQLIGGRHGWQKIWLTSLNWLNDKQHGFVLAVNGTQFRLQIQSAPAQPATPSAAPAQVVSREVSKLLTKASYYARNPDTLDARILSLKIPGWQVVAKLYQQAGLPAMEVAITRIAGAEMTDLSQINAEKGQMIRTLDEFLATPPGSAIFFVENLADKPLLQHVMIMAYGGFAIGVNNQIIGGGAGWQRLPLIGLAYQPDCRLGLRVVAGQRGFSCIVLPPAADRPQ